MNKKSLFGGMALLLFSVACGISVPGANSPIAPVNSPIPSFTPSRTPVPSVTPYPTPTRRATSAEFLTMIAPPTILSGPSLTPAYVEAIAGGDNTSPSTSIPFLNLYTPTPPPLRCKVELLKPAFGEDFRPGTDFIVAWRLFNTGSSRWSMNDFQYEFVSGDKLHNPNNTEPELLPITVYVNDKIRFDMHMFAPKIPGRYTATWGLSRTNKKDPFCFFSVTIDVVK